RARRDCEHGADARVEQALRDAPDQKAGDASVAVRADDDQICVDLQRDPRDRARGVVSAARANDEGGVEPADLQVFDLLADLLAELAFVCEHGKPAAPPDKNLARMSDN